MTLDKNGQPVIDVRDLRKTYRLGDVGVKALNGITLCIERDEFVAVMGHSGSGKSTFMNLIGCLDQPTSGEYYLEGENVSRMSRDELAAIRNTRIGFVFQSFNLLPRTTALENVELPMVYSGIGPEEQVRRAQAALELVGLGDRLARHTAELSGGEQQRVAIARALVNNPSLILADEPTGNLDTQTSEEIMAVLKRLNAEQGMMIVLVTHETDIAAWARRVVTFRDGLVIDDRRSPAGAGVPA